MVWSVSNAVTGVPPAVWIRNRNDAGVLAGNADVSGVNVKPDDSSLKPFPAAMPDMLDMPGMP